MHFDDHMVLLVERKADKENRQNEGYDKACEDILGVNWIADQQERGLESEFEWRLR